MDMDRPFVIIIAGMYRSGTTWQFNTVRLLCERAGYDDVIGCEWDGSGRAPDADVVIVKRHKYTARLAAAAHVVFTSERDWANAADSYYRLTGERPTAQDINTWQRWLEEWELRSAYHMSFPLLHTLASRTLTTHCIGRELWLAGLDRFGSMPLSVIRDVAEAVDAIEPPTDVDYDPVTMLFRNHMTSRGVKR